VQDERLPDAAHHFEPARLRKLLDDFTHLVIDTLWW
jgi:hypothetical protein